jgi:hypothetical protein
MSGASMWLPDIFLAEMLPTGMLLAEMAGSLGPYLIWSGLFALLLAPAVLARTRWSDSPPLLICVSLSVVAHLLLTIYAYATRLPHVETGAGGGGTNDGEVVIALNLLDDASFLANMAVDSAADMSVEAETKSVSSDSDATKSRTIADTKAALEREDPDDSPSPRENSGQTDNLEANPTDSLDDPPVGQRVDFAPPPDLMANEPADATAYAAAESKPERQDESKPAPSTELMANSPREAKADPVIDPNTASKAASPANTADNGAAADIRIAAETGAVDAQPSANALPEIAKPASENAKVNQVEIATAPPSRATTTPNAPTTDSPMPSAMDTQSTPAADSRFIAASVPQAYRNRQSNRRYATALRQGGSAETEAAVESALDWLAANQSPEGVWAAAATGAGREARVLGQDRGGAGAHADAGLTALALLAFLGAGETHLDGPRRQSVQHGLEYLLRIQRADGELAGSADLFARMYCHGMATLAISEAYALTGDARLRPALDAAVGYTIRAQDPNGGGWRYRPGDAGDTSQFGWQLMSLKSAQLAGLSVPPNVWERARKFLRTVSSGSDAGLASYRPGERPSRTMTAEALFCRILLDDSQPAQAREALRFVAQEPPGVGPDNHYYWYYGTLAQFQTQSDTWRNWNEALQRQLLARQQTAGPLRGSWDPDSVWGTHGGRVFSTALSALSLEVYYRYLPLYQTARLEGR